jgi:RNA polymerase sigma-70 factor, ECF subfamily
MNSQNEECGPSQDGIEQFRSYLLLLAQIQLAEQNRRIVDASDIVQKSLMEAHVQRADYRGEPNEIIAWLRKILANNIRDAFRFDHRQKRDHRREVSLEESFAHTSQRLALELPAKFSSPSHHAIRHEELIQLSDAMQQLPMDQRQAVALHHLQEWTLKEIASHLEKSEAAVGGLLFRGLRNLKQLLRDSNKSS